MAGYFLGEGAIHTDLVYIGAIIFDCFVFNYFAIPRGRTWVFWPMNSPQSWTEFRGQYIKWDRVPGTVY